MTSAETTPAADDGRRLRRERNRRAVVGAILDLLGEGETKPTAQLVADRSGVSIRSIFRQFDDIAGLHSEAIEEQVRRVAHLSEALPTDGPLEARIAAVVATRGRLYEAISPVRRFATRVAEPGSPIAGELQRSRAAWAEEVGRTFGPELATLDAIERQEVLDALVLLTGWESWEQLRTTSGRSAKQAERVLVRSLSLLLAAP